MESGCWDAAVTVAEIASKKGSFFCGENVVVRGIAALSYASADDISFYTGDGVGKEICQSHAGVIFVNQKFYMAIGQGKELLERLPHVRAIIVVEDSYATMVWFLKTFYIPHWHLAETFVSPKAFVHKTAFVEGIVLDGAHVGPFCVVERGAIVSENCVLESRVTLYAGTILGKNCTVQSGAVLGSAGFGFYAHQRVPHVAGVRIGGNSSIGANTVVASGFISPTVIGEDSHIDSLVQIGHNCQIGNRVYMASQCGLAGTTIVGDDVEFGGAAKAAGHLTIGNGAKVAAKAGVTKNVPAGMIVSGFPAEDIGVWRRQIVAIRRLVSMCSHSTKANDEK